MVDGGGLDQSTEPLGVEGLIGEPRVAAGGGMEGALPRLDPGREP